MVCAALMLMLGSSITMAQYPYPTTNTPATVGNNQANYQYSQPKAPYPTAQPSNTQYQAAPYPATQYAAPQPQTQPQSAAPYPTAQPSNTQYQAAPYPTTPQPTASSYQGNPYPATQYTTPQSQAQPQPTAPYPNTQQPANQYATVPYPATNSYSNTTPPANTTPYPATRPPIETARYIPPSTAPLTSGARQPFSARPEPYNPPAATPYTNTPYTGPALQPATQSDLLPTPNNASAPTGSTGSIEGQTIVDVQIIGNRNVSKERVESMIRTRKGREFSEEAVQHDIRAMSRSGLFVNVKPSYRETPQGPIVIFEVIERPTLESIKFVGARAIKRKTLLKEANLKEGDAADPFAVEEARKSLEYYYRDKGFSQARISVHKGNKTGDREVVFVINEGSKQKILWTKFIGNSIASDSRLKTQIESKEGILWFINGEFSYERVEEDAKKLEDYYRSLGYFDAKVGPEVSFSFDNWAKVTFVINEGPRYKVRDVRFIGNKIYREDQLRTGLEISPGDYFNRSKMDADLHATQERYGRVGYVFADIKAEPRFLDEPGTLDMVYNIKEGDQHTVGRVIVKIKGDGETPRTKNSVVLNRMHQKPGDIVDTQKIRDSEREIRASGVFATNPATGQIPKILITPPKELEERDPRSPYYGQSPSSQARGQNW
jgi:outer membrane protein insertion porin family